MSAELATAMALVTLPTCPVCGHQKRHRAPATPSTAQLAFRFRGQLRLVVSAERQARLEALVLDHQDLVERVAAKIGRRLPPHIPRADLVAVGSVGLLQAAEAFAPAAGYPFRRFASSRIYGAIIDDLRSRSILKRRGLEKARRGEAAAFEHPLADEQDPDRRDASHTGADMGLMLPPVPATQLDALIAADTLEALFDRIPARDARLIRAIYLEGQSEEDIAARCGAKPADVRRQAARALEALRALAGRG